MSDASIDTERLPDPKTPRVDDVYSYPRESGQRGRLVVCDVVHYTSQPADGLIILLIAGEQRMLKSYAEFRRFLVSLSACSIGSVVHNG